LINIMSSALNVAGVHHVENILVARDGKYAKYIRTDADIAHGVLMGIAIVLFFPIGGLIARLSKSRHMLWIHVTCQVAGLIVFLGGFGTGVWTCIVHDEVYPLTHNLFLANTRGRSTPTRTPRTAQSSSASSSSSPS
jgi:hypothetical protein